MKATTPRERERIWKSVRSQLRERREEPRNWWHDSKRPARSSDVRSNFNSGSWGGARFFALVPASRYAD